VRRVEQGRLAYYREKADAAFWDRHWSGMLSRGAYAEAEKGFLGWFEKPFAAYLPPTGKILEAGCGMGQHVVALRVRGYDAIGIEWAPKTVQAARSIFPTLPVEVGDVTALDVPDGQFAGYISLGVMEHRREGPEPFLREAFRVLAPGGIAMISVPHFHPLRRAKGLLGAYRGETADLEFYQYAYGVGEFVGQLRAAGFEVLDRWGYDGVKGLKDELPWLRRLLVHERYGPRLRSILARTPHAERWFGHMMLYICRRPAVPAPVEARSPELAPQNGGSVQARPTLQLGVFFTRGMSLRSWEEIGMLEREMALYCRLRDRGVGITLITYGGKEDVSYESRFPGVRVLANASALPQAEYEATLEHVHGAVLASLDVFKTNQTSGADIALRVARHFGKPLIARCGYMWSTFATLESGSDSPSARDARAVEQAVFPQATRVVVTTPAMAQDIVRRFPGTGDRVAVIPNYVDTALFDSTGRQKVQRDLLFVGRLVPQKNLTALLDAIAPLPLRLGIIGRGPLEPILRDHPASLNGKVEWIGGVPSRDLPDYFRSSRAFILPSLYEGHPKVLLEAMACGSPVIGTRVPGIASVLVHEQNGLLCAPTAEGLRHAVQQLLNDEGLANRLGAAARRYVLEHCTLDSVVEKELAVLTGVMRRDGLERESNGGITSMSTLSRENTRSSLGTLLDSMANAECVDAVGSYVADRARSTTPDEGLRMLFRLEDVLYTAEGELAVRYGKGVHTKHRHTGYHDFFIRRVHQGESVLDVGCGVGAVAQDVAERCGATVTGIDISRENIAAAQRMHAHPGVRYIVGDALEMEQFSGAEVVILSNVLEHLAGRPGFLRKLLARTCPKRVLIRVPLFERDWRIPLRQELNVEYRLDPTHETEYTLDSFAAEMEEAGLRVMHQEVRWGEIWAECIPLGAPKSAAAESAASLVAASGRAASQQDATKRMVPQMDASARAAYQDGASERATPQSGAREAALLQIAAPASAGPQHVAPVSAVPPDASLRSISRQHIAPETAVPRVSVVLSTHNDAPYLPLALESLFQQTFEDFECIIIDDASTDETAEILERYADPRIRLVRHESRQGLTHSLIEAVALCRGEYLARMDGDDLALPTRFAQQVAFLDNHPDIGLVGTGFMYIDGQNNLLGAEPVYTTDEQIRSRLLTHNCFGHGTVMLRRSVLNDTGGYDPTYRYAQDYDLWLRIAERCGVANLPDRLYCWRQTGNGISAEHTAEQQAFAERAKASARARGILPGRGMQTPLLAVTAPAGAMP